MNKISVSSLAETLGLESREVLQRLKEIGVDAKTPTSKVDESVAKKLMAAQPKEGGTEEVRVTTNIIRRRAKTVTASDEPESAPVEVKEEKVAPVTAPVVVATPAPVEVKAAEPSVAAQVIQVQKPVEQSAAPEKVVAPLSVEPPKTPVADQPKTGPNQARILGRMEIPGVTSRPTRVIGNDVPQAKPYPARQNDPSQRRPSTSVPSRPAGSERPGSERSGSERPGSDRPNQDRSSAPRPVSSRPGSSAPSSAPSAGAPDRSRMKQVPLAPAAPPMGEDRRKFGGKPAGPHGDDGKGGKKGGPSAGKKKELPKKHEILEKRERIFDPVYKGSRKKGKERPVETKRTEITVPKAIKRIIRITETISVGELAKRMGIKATDLIKSLMKMGMMVTINHPLDFDTAAILSSEYGYEIENVAVDLDEIHDTVPDAPETLEKRPPVVTIMGHVDHGKTSLLDAIREANVIAGEAGGITQHIGAYDVELGGRKITFLDTPGHEAFTAMRARGAKVTDIVVLVVAADDGVMPQTREAINHSKAAGVPIIIAVNKIDKPDAKPERVKQELMEFGLVSSDWGGDTTIVEVSAKKRLNLEELLEMILLQADVMDLKANPDKQAKGTIVEAKLDKGRGPVATVLVQEGTLKNGDYCVVGIHSGRVRAMQNDRGERVLEAGPSMPVEVIGLSGVPDAGDIFVAMKDEKQAKEIATLRQIKYREVELAKHSKITLEDLYKQIQSGEVKDLNVIVKGDVQGSVEAVSETLRKLSTDAVRLNVIHSGVGAITETDVNLAAASNTIIIGFSVRPEVKAQALAEKEGVDIRLYSIIYDAVEDVKKAMEGLLDPTLKEKYLGRAEIREVFSVPKVGNVAGCYIQDGKMLRNAQVRLVRDSIVVYTGKLSSLRRIKDDVKEVATGYECGIGLENYHDIKIGDFIEAFEIEKIATKL